MTSTGERGLVLVVEDDRAIVELVALYLRRDGFGVLTESDGEAALAAVRRHRPVAIVLDVGLPGMDGIEVCRRLRAGQDRTPVLFVTARDDEVDRILGLEIGADDYVTKPFSPRELVARVRAVLRRSEEAPRTPSVIEIAGWEIDSGRREVRGPDGSVVRPTAREFDLLWYLAENQGLVLSRGQILEAVWGYEYLGETRTVDVHIRQLRKKLEHLPIETAWGVGYRMGD